MQVVTLTDSEAVAIRQALERIEPADRTECEEAVLLKVERARHVEEAGPGAPTDMKGRTDPALRFYEALRASAQRFVDEGPRAPLGAGPSEAP